ncbi:MAG: hypothetical protein K0S85_152 [Pseudomonas orientalis]|jgi:hypothetical protein|nr:hypothetical protein [Pseudomonas orientalis]
MRVWGWLMTAVGCTGLLVSLILFGAAVFGVLDQPGQAGVLSLVGGAISALLILAGGRVRFKSKPLLPIAL